MPPAGATGAARSASPVRPAARSRRFAYAWLAVFIVSGVLLAHFYPHSAFEDAGTHFLFARSAWHHAEIFVSVWGRPLFTVLFAVPALLGYPVAKLVTVVVCAVTAWQAYRIAVELDLERPELVIPLLYLQPTYFLLSADTMTEPLFAMILVIALRLHLRGQIRSGMIVASLMILARPEGFFLGVLWGVWVLFDRRDTRPWWRRIPSVAWLALGAVAWWLAALLITHDPLFIRHNWPGEWTTTPTALTLQPLLDSMHKYWLQRMEITGKWLFVPFAVGFVVLIARRRLGTLTSAFLTIFLLHGVFRAYGIFHSTGEPRYFITVAPAIALIMLVGWNAIARLLAWLPRPLITALAAIVLVRVAIATVYFVDGIPWARDALAVRQMYGWFEDHKRPVHRLIWSQTYMCILFGRDAWEEPKWEHTWTRDGWVWDHARNVQLIRNSPPGTLVFWDTQTGPTFWGITASDFAANGYTLLRDSTYVLDGYFKRPIGSPYRGPETVHLYLLYKE